MILDHLLRWWRSRWLCQCCRRNVRDEHYWVDAVGGKLCDDCMSRNCTHVLSPGPAHWIHRREDGKKMPHTAADYREQDTGDLMKAWRRAMDVLRYDSSSPSLCRAQETFDEILNYFHAGETPQVPESEGNQRLVTLTHIHVSKPKEGSD